MAQTATGCDIKISTNEPRVSVGGSLPLTVSFQNQTEKALIFRERNKTWEVQLRVTDSAGATVQRAFGVILRTDWNGISRKVLENAKEITLPPGGTHAFQSDVLHRWPDLFPPGRYTLRVIDLSDDQTTLQSNTLEIECLFSIDSMNGLLEILRTDKKDPASDEFALAWLNRFYPEETVRVREALKTDRSSIAGLLDELLKKWRQDQQRTEVLRQLDEINRRALGVP